MFGSAVLNKSIDTDCMLTFTNYIITKDVFVYPTKNLQFAETIYIPMYFEFEDYRKSGNPMYSYNCRITMNI